MDDFIDKLFIDYKSQNLFVHQQFPHLNHKKPQDKKSNKNIFVLIDISCLKLLVKIFIINCYSSIKTKI